jgi:hypothetical protein
MTKEADDFNADQLAKQRLTIEHITELVTHWQETHSGLSVDGKAGTQQTIPSIAQSISRRSGPAAGNDLAVDAHWLIGPGVTRIDAHASWYGGALASNKPLGIVAHYTDTAPGTAVNMARRRAREFGKDPTDRRASWHITIETDGSVVVMVPFNRTAWHAGSETAQPVPGLGNANANTLGIELVGSGKDFPPAQVTAACKVWRAVVKHYAIARQHAMITHQSIDPTRRNDPGPVWMGQHAAGVLDFAYRP